MPDPVTPNGPLDAQTKGPPAQSSATDSTQSPPLVDERKIAGSMHTEEPDGWDQAPQDIHNPRQKRHPRPDGKGGVVGDASDQRAGDTM